MREKAEEQGGRLARKAKRLGQVLLAQRLRLGLGPCAQELRLIQRLEKQLLIEESSWP